MPRAGLDVVTVVAAGAELADEVGFDQLTLGLLADRLGVRTPSLYKHIANQADLHRRIAVLAIAEAADVIGEATQGCAGRDALAAAARAFRGFVLTHPGRYAATLGIGASAVEDDLAVEERRFFLTLRAVLRAYEIAPGQLTHALRTLRSSLHGFATLQSAGGFQWDTDIDESYEWLITLLDRGLRGMDRDA